MRSRTGRGRQLRRIALAGMGLWFVLGGGWRASEAESFPESPRSAELAVAADATAPKAPSAVSQPVDVAPSEEFAQAHEPPEGAAAHVESPTPSGAEHEISIRKVFFVLIFILLLGKLCGELAERGGQPAVLGELTAGVLLGSSVLGVIPPMGTPIGDLVHVFAEIGVSILLFEIGLETDLKEMFRVGPTALMVALVGVCVPFGLGFLYWYNVNPSIGAHPPGITFAIVALFVGATLTATSVGITARVLSDLGRIHTPEARIIIGAAVIDDVLGIVILAVVAGLAGGSAVGVLAIGKIFVFAVGFLVLAVVVGNKAIPILFDMVNRMRVRGVLLVTAFCFALGVAALADLAGSAMIIGAFAAGIVLSSTNQFDAVVERIEPVADIFTPIFFVAVGAPVNVGLVIPGVRRFLPGAAEFNLRVLVVGGILTAIAIVGKIAAGIVVRRGTARRIVVGVGMIPRGEVGLIFASIGLTGGILSDSVYSAILIMVMASTFIVPPILKILFREEGTVEGSVAVQEFASGP